MLTVLIDLQTVFPVGALLTLFARRLIESELVGPLSRYVRRGALFGLLYGLAVGYWCFAYPDWMWGYALDAAAWSTWWWYPGFVIALGIVGGAGALLAQTCIAGGHFWRAFGVCLLGAWLLASVWAMSFEAYANLSTYAQWHTVPRGLAVPTNEDPNWVLGSIIVAIVMVGFALYTMVSYVREGRRLPRH